MEAQLKNKGWFLTNEGMELCKEGLVKPSVDTLTQRALDIDLRLLSCGNQDDANKGKTDSVQGPLILQIQKIRNVAAPKINEDSNYAPKLLRIQLSDGRNTYSGLVLHSIPKIDMNSPPGTKILIKGNLALKQGLMLLDQNNTKVLGGHVDEMVERWKLAKSLSQLTRATKVEGAPPPWVPFGQRNKLSATQKNSHSIKGSKKSLDTNQKDPTETDKAFEEQRKAAIQELGKHQSKKFGGGKAVPSNQDRQKEFKKANAERQDSSNAGNNNKSSQPQGIYRDLSHDSNKPDERDVQMLTSMGFDRDASITALKKTNGNVDAAVDAILSGGGDSRGSGYRGQGFHSRGGGQGAGRGSSDSRRGGRNFDSRSGGRGSDSRGRGRGSDSRRRRNDDNDNDNEEYPSQPSGAATLFDFVESKLGTDSSKGKSTSNYNSGSERSRNYAREQPPSVKESGIRFVHGAENRRGDDRKGGSSKDESFVRSNQTTENRRGQNQKKPNPRQYDSHPQNDRGPSGRTRPEKGTSQSNARSNSYTLPPRFQKLQEAESKKTPSSNQEDRERGSSQRKDAGPGPSQQDTPHLNGKPNQGPHRGSGSFRSQQRSSNPNYEQISAEENAMIQWNIGDICLAKYWEDNGFYNATITAMHPSGKTCVVHFMEYGNQEEVFVSDILPLQNQSWGGMPGPHQFPPPNHMMVPPHFQDSRGNFQRGRYNPNHGNGHYYQGRR